MENIEQITSKRLQYNSGVFNNKNEILLAKTLNMAMDKIAELVEQNNELVKVVKELQERPTHNFGGYPI